jgi:hypothetical protein
MMLSRSTYILSYLSMEDIRCNEIGEVMLRPRLGEGATLNRVTVKSEEACRSRRHKLDRVMKIR